jgi:hypothetical protein
MIDDLYGGHVSPLWAIPKVRVAFEAMFINQAKVYDPDSQRVTEEVLHVGKGITDLTASAETLQVRIPAWNWYVRERVSPADNGRAFLRRSPEEKLLSYLLPPSDTSIKHNEEGKKIILVYGKTGHGKTTFLRHFFNKWLPEHEENLTHNMIVLRISMAAAATNRNAEDDVDNRVNRLLRKAAPWLTDKEHMLAMAKMEWTVDTDYRDELLKSIPQGDSDEDKLDWFRLVALRNPRSSSSSRRSKNARILDRRKDYHDFNRLAINYLVTTFKWRFVIILDNIDQTPINFQEEVFMLARHKLDWILKTQSVVMVLGVRDYLLDRVKKEFVVQAYDEQRQLRIYPPPIASVLSERLPFFEALCPQKVPLDPGDFPKRVGRQVEQLTLTREAIVRGLRGLIQILGNTSIRENIANMSNYDVRHQIKLVRRVFRSWVINWYDFANLTVDGMTVRCNFYDVLSAILKEDNLLCSQSPEQIIYNLFSGSETDHDDFSATLNAWYVLRLIEKGHTAIEDLVKILGELGHSPGTTLGTIGYMLHANIVTSREGIYLREHAIKNITQRWSDTTMGSIYLDLLPFELRYLEAMAYQTPYELQIGKELPEPQETEQPPDFSLYVKAAHVLLKQVHADEKRQLDYAVSHNAMTILQQYDLLGLSRRIAESVYTTLSTLEGARREAEGDIPPKVWRTMFEWFKPEQYEVLPLKTD